MELLYYSKNRKVGKREVKGLLEIPSRRWDVNIKMDRKQCVGSVWTGLIWLRIGITGGLL